MLASLLSGGNMEFWIGLLILSVLYTIIRKIIALIFKVCFGVVAIILLCVALTGYSQDDMTRDISKQVVVDNKEQLEERISNLFDEGAVTIDKNGKFLIRDSNIALRGTLGADGVQLVSKGVIYSIKLNGKMVNFLDDLLKDVTN